MKVPAILALAFSSLAHGATVSMMKHRGVSFGPKNCVRLTRSSAGSCVISTACDGVDTSKTEFAFDCMANDGIVRHSFGTGGFDSSEEFDTEVKCDRCEKPSPVNVAKKLAAKKSPPPPKATPLQPQRVKRAMRKAEVPQRRAAPVALKARSRKARARSVKAAEDPVPVEVVKDATSDAKDATSDVHSDAKDATSDVHSDAKDATSEVEKVADEAVDKWEGARYGPKKEEVTRYGPDGCVSTWKSKDNHCLIRTDCAKADISKYEFGLVCIDKVGSPVRHLFGKDSFDKEETFDTLIQCDKCLGLEDIPDSVALNGEVTTMSKDISNLKAVMKNISINVRILNEEVFQDATPAKAKEEGAKEEDKMVPVEEEAEPHIESKTKKQALLHHSTSHHRQEVRSEGEKKHNLRHSQERHHERREDDDDDDEGYDDEEEDDHDDRDDRDKRESDHEANVEDQREAVEHSEDHEHQDMDYDE